MIVHHRNRAYRGYDRKYASWTLRIWKTAEASVYDLVHGSPGLFQDVIVTGDATWTVFLVTFVRRKTKAEVVALWGAIFAASPTGVVNVERECLRLRAAYGMLLNLIIPNNVN